MGSGPAERNPFGLLLNGGPFRVSPVKDEEQTFREHVRGPTCVISVSPSPVLAVFPVNGQALGNAEGWDLLQHVS